MGVEKGTLSQNALAVYLKNSCDLIVTGRDFHQQFVTVTAEALKFEECRTSSCGEFKPGTRPLLHWEMKKMSLFETAINGPRVLLCILSERIAVVHPQRQRG